MYQRPQKAFTWTNPCSGEEEVNKGAGIGTLASGGIGDFLAIIQ